MDYTDINGKPINIKDKAKKHIKQMKKNETENNSKSEKVKK